MDAYPFANRSRGIPYRHGADGEAPVDSVCAPHSMLKHKLPAFGNRAFPFVDSWLHVFGMHRFRPSPALILFIGLPRKGCPGWLIAFHAAFSVVGPNDAANSADGGAKTSLALSEGFFGVAARGHIPKDQHDATDLSVSPPHWGSRIVDSSPASIP